MIIKSIELENIRSYKNEEIIFKEGINFLSGDIGSGKSSILQALEFGFLGFKKGDLEGIHLLRKGENKASVKIILKIKNKYFEIYRKIKKSKSGHISQENGYIKFEDNLLELSPKEMDSKIFEILNFPKEFLNKDKNLIYRFTIYTPQEQLKEIIFSNSDKKLEIIRKIFAIDKYKQLKDGIQIYMGEIRENKSFFKGKLENKEDINLKIKEIKNEIKNIKNQIIEIQIKYDEIILEKEEKNLIEEKYNLLFENIINKKILIEKNLSKIEEFENQKNKLEKDLKTEIEIKKEFENINFEKKIKIEKNKIYEIELKINEILNEKNKIEKNKNIKKKLDEKILKINFEMKNIKESIENLNLEEKNIIHLSECNKCKQIVSLKHKENLKTENLKIKNDKENILNQLEIEKEKFSIEIEKLMENKKSFNDRIYDLNENEKNYNKEIFNIKLNIEKTKNLILKSTEIKSEIEKIKNKIEKINFILLKKENLKNNKKILIEKENKFKFKFKKIKNDLNEINTIQREISNKISILKNNLKINNENLINLEIENQEKEKLEQEFEKILKIENFLSNKMIKIADSIERTIFTKFYLEFNEEFEKFFKELIEDNEIEVRLSNEFSPIIEQNGYDVDISNLSGGEKSSLAISYRFGLKKIIESNMNSTQTLSLLILDEPTDGFSTNQVDRLGEILKEFDLKQIILVSHDTRIESICDNILNIEKINHISFLNN